MSYHFAFELIPCGTEVKIAKPLLAVSTPVGVVWGVVEAYRFHRYLAVLMVLLLTVVGAFLAFTFKKARGERSAQPVSRNGNLDERQ